MGLRLQERTGETKVPAGRNFFDGRELNTVQRGCRLAALQGAGKVMRDNKLMNAMGSVGRRRDEELGPNSDIGNKLRALYGAVQEEGIPPKLLELLDRLDEAEQRAAEPPTD